MSEKFVKDFDSWNEYKKKLEKRRSPLIFFIEKFGKKRKAYRVKEGEIWWCSVGVNLGCEMCGKNKHFERPVLILRKSGRLLVCLPLTSKRPSSQRFHFDVSFIVDGVETSSFVAFTSPKSYDILRLRRKIRRLNDEKFNLLKQLSYKYYTGKKI